MPALVKICKLAVIVIAIVGAATNISIGNWLGLTVNIATIIAVA